MYVLSYYNGSSSIRSVVVLTKNNEEKAYFPSIALFQDYLLMSAWLSPKFWHSVEVFHRASSLGPVQLFC